uniref:ATGSL11 (Glucan synthase-like 11) n=1 Tax=Arundo donax TaxID=35708 RepID=A0A0A9GXU1_ARUDO
MDIPSSFFLYRSSTEKSTSSLKYGVKTLKDIMLRTCGALGIFMKSEFAKNLILRLASKFVGTYIADSFVANNN